MSIDSPEPTPMTTDPAPRQGIEDALPAEQYHAIDACSSSRLKDMELRSPAYAHHRITNPQPSTEAQVRGTATHAAILEPETLEDLFLVGGQCEATKKSTGERCSNKGTVYRDGAWFCGVRGHAPKLEDSGEGDPLGSRIVLPEDVWDDCRRIRDAVQSHPIARALLKREVHREVSVFWGDTKWKTGIACKGRPDIFTGDMVGDVKVSRKASPAQFSDHAARSYLHVQAAFYLAGLEEVGRAPEDFLWIAAQPDAPHEVATYVADAELLRCGREQARRSITRYAKCVETGVWPAYPDTLLTLDSPYWMVRDLFPEECAG